MRLEDFLFPFILMPFCVRRMSMSFLLLLLPAPRRSFFLFPQSGIHQKSSARLPTCLWNAGNSHPAARRLWWPDSCIRNTAFFSLTAANIQPSFLAICSWLFFSNDTVTASSLPPLQQQHIAACVVFCLFLSCWEWISLSSGASKAVMRVSIYCESSIRITASLAEMLIM